MKTTVSEELCIGCELCPSISPNLYEMNSDDKAVAVKSELSENEIIEAREAADSCPVDAISIV